MKFEVCDSEVETEGFSQTASFSIAASGKAFKGLIDGLYSRKIEACVRELATNAFDAHAAANNDAPFEVNLPSVVNPVFSIRDFGTGMSHELMMVRYTTMFDSTKDGLVAADCEVVAANKQVGMLGLGSKAFFAYTDSCTITVWMEGEVRYYSVYMGEDGIPKISLAGQAASDEPRGVKVEFAVASKDIENFANAAIRVFKGFPLIPKGLRTDVVKKIQADVRHQGEFWKIYDAEFLPGDYKIWARQGCVLYPIDLTLIDDKCTIPERRYSYSVIKYSDEFQPYSEINGVMVIDFPIGTIDFDLSRENLAYNSKTIEGVKQRLAYLIESLDEEFAPLYAKCKNGWDRFQLSHRLGWMGPLFHRTKWFKEYSDILYRLTHHMPSDRDDRYNERLFHADLYFNIDEEEFEEERAKEEDPQIWASQNVAQTAYSRKERGSFSADFHRLVLFESDAAKTLTNRRCYYHMFKHGFMRGLVMARGVQITPALRKSLGNPPIVKVSETELAPKVSYGYGWSGDAPPPFERFKVLEGSYYEGIELDGPEPEQVFLFLNKGKIWNPQRSEKDYALSHTHLKALIPFLKEHMNKELVFINIRSNEFAKTLTKWADYPLLYDILDDVEKLVEKKFTHKIIKHTNNRRFAASDHNNFLTFWKETFGVNVEDEPVKAIEPYSKPVELPFNQGVYPFINAVRTVVEKAEEAGKLIPENPELLPEPWMDVQKVVLRNRNMHEEDRKLFFSVIRERAKEKMQCN